MDVNASFELLDLGEVDEIWDLFCEDAHLGNASLLLLEKCTNGTELQPDNFREFLRVLHLVFTPLVIGLGLIFNLLSFLVFTVTHLRRQSSSIYLASLALVDIIFLISLSFIWMARLPTDKLAFYHRNIWCQIVHYCTNVTRFLSMWYVVSFTIERYIIVHYPLRKDRYCNTTRAKRVVITLAVVSCLMYSYVPFTTGVKDMGNAIEVCMPLPQFYSFHTVATILDTIITFLIPSCIIVTLNIRIVIKIVKVSRHRRNIDFPSEIVQRSQHESIMEPLSTSDDRCKIACSWSREKKGTVVLHPSISHRNGGLKFIRIASGRMRAQQRTARVLIIVSSVFVLVNLPTNVFRMYGHVTVSLNTSFGVHLHAKRWQQLFEFIQHLHFAMNFFLYTCYATQFTDALKKLAAVLSHKISLLCQRLNANGSICHKGNNDGF